MANVKRCDVCSDIYEDTKARQAGGRTIMIRSPHVKMAQSLDLCRECNDYFGFAGTARNVRTDLLRLLRKLFDERTLV